MSPCLRLFLGTAAAAMQSAIGGAVAAGSPFALAQAAAMGGIAVAPLPGLVAGTAALVTGVKAIAENAGGAHSDKPVKSKL